MDPILLVAILVVVGVRAVGNAATDVAYGIRGKKSPRWEARKAAIKAAAETGRPVRYGFGGYMADLVDDAWTRARQRRERKMSGQAPAKNAPMRSYLGKLWGHRWEDAGIKHDRKHRARQVKRGLVDPDAPVDGNVDDAFDTVPRDTTPPAGPVPAAAEVADSGQVPATASPPPQWSKFLTVSQLGMTQLPSATDLADQIRTQHAAYHEQMARDHARQLAIRDLMQSKLNTPEWQSRAQQLMTSYPDTWHQHLRTELAADVATDADLQQQTTNRYRLLMNQVNAKHTPPQEEEPAPNPPPAAASLADVGFKDLDDRQDVFDHFAGKSRGFLAQIARLRAGEEAEREVMLAILNSEQGQAHLAELKQRAETDLLLGPATVPEQMADWLQIQAAKDPRLAEQTNTRHAALLRQFVDTKEDTTAPTETKAETAEVAASTIPNSNVVSLSDFINRKDTTDMTTNTASAEVVGLDNAIIFAEQSKDHHSNQGPDLELFGIGLAEGGCGQGTLGLVEEIKEANDVLQQLFEKLHTALVADKVTVGDAYNARPDAGTKPFVTS